MFHSDVWSLLSSTLTYNEEMTIDLVEQDSNGDKVQVR